ncbi:metallophosphoesterase [Luteolibacter sp. LG18]|uniref:metallophosphoesterase n=1 Tax=Luteolibacter sp. LG18 TaxID=2819286 RepID=UPI002B28679E|nr:acid phosphatase [Luteolibacter sp. LG18]
MNRRRLLKTAFCSSLALGLNLRRSEAAPDTPAGSLELLAIGDFGSAEESQWAVARGMTRYTQALPKPPHGMLMLGDNFYGGGMGSVDSPRWKKGFEDCYPKEVFPGPCWAILGNHDYAETAGQEKAELDYAKRPEGTRWTMPAKYYRLDLPKENPVITLLMIDTDWEPINRAIHAKLAEQRPIWMTDEEKKAQMAWLEKELQSKRAPFTAVVGHHPVYSNGPHNDTKELVDELAPLLETHGVHVYLGGHDHDLQHLEIQGKKTSFVISGGGGRRLTDIHENHSAEFAQAVFGFSHLSITTDKLVLRHIDANGKLLHAFEKTPDFKWKTV